MSWLSTNWGNLASVLGLALSIAVFIVAKRAKDAAEATKHLIGRRTLASDLRACMDDSNFLNVLQENRRWELAGHVTYRLLQAVAYLQGRWAVYLDANAREALAGVVSQLDTIHEQLAKFATHPPSNVELDSLGSSVRRVGSALTAQAGRQESLSESVVTK